jgi:hypothetical protein
VVVRRFGLRDGLLAKRSLYSELLAKRSLYNELCMRICMMRMGWSEVPFNQAFFVRRANSGEVSTIHIAIGSLTSFTTYIYHCSHIIDHESAECHRPREYPGAAFALLTIQETRFLIFWSPHQVRSIIS